jgi:hypothetical protein
LQKSINKYGISNFEIIILEIIDEIKDYDYNIFFKRESYYINLFSSYSPKGYNIAKVYGDKEKDEEELTKIKKRIDKNNKIRKEVSRKFNKVNLMCGQCVNRIAIDELNIDYCNCGYDNKNNIGKFYGRLLEDKPYSHIDGEPNCVDFIGIRYYDEYDIGELNDFVEGGYLNA